MQIVSKRKRGRANHSEQISDALMVLQCAKLSDYVRPFCGKSRGRANTGDEFKVVASGVDQMGDAAILDRSSG